MNSKSNFLISLAIAGIASAANAQSLTLGAAPTVYYYDPVLGANVTQETDASLTMSSGTQTLNSSSVLYDSGNYVFASQQMTGSLASSNVGSITADDYWASDFASGQGGGYNFGIYSSNPLAGFSVYNFNLGPGGGSVSLSESFAASGTGWNTGAFGAQVSTVEVDGNDVSSPYYSGVQVVSLNAGAHTIAVENTSNLGGRIGVESVSVNDTVNFNISGNVEATPEPATLGVLGIGLLAALRRRTRV